MAGAAVIDEVEADDIQGIVFGGFGKLREARFLLLEVDDPARARAYLRALVVASAKELRHAESRGTAIQIAFTSRGLRALGLPEETIREFSREFEEGLDDDVRSDELGDRGRNDPVHWEWGRAKDQPPVHGLLLFYATPSLFEARLRDELGRLAGAFHVREKPTRLLPDSKEHFGWRDGIATPIVEKDGKKHPRWTPPIRIGEFVLGYHNEYKQEEHDTYTESPTVARDADPRDLLPATRDGLRKDLGRNGSYLVYREMTQDVFAFWRYAVEQAGSVEAAITLGAKMVGRWPSGAPLIRTPDADDAALATANDFSYAKDKQGFACPLGSHIRRANPRDHLAIDRPVGDSTEMVRKHQMVRRGRPFGEPVAASMETRALIERRDEPDGERRGLHFICVVAHLGRQFEFVQRAWLNSANFLGLFKDGDPIAAARRTKDEPNTNDQFTVQACPVRRKYKDMPEFTRVVGGAYFFLPGLRALRYIAEERP